MAGSRGQRNSAGRGSGGSREQILPLTAVGKIMKQVLPAKARISKEAKERVQECSSKFAAVIFERAAHDCKNDGRSEINGRDILLAMSKLGLHDYVDKLQNYLPQYWNIDQPEAEPETEPETEQEPEQEQEPEPEPEPEPEMSTRPTQECRLRQFRDGGDYPNGILAVGTAERFQRLPALILRKIY